MDGRNANSFPERLLQRLGPHSVLVMMLITWLGGAVAGLLVLYYVELTLEMSDATRTQFRTAGVIAVAAAVSLTLLIAQWETRTLRRALRKPRRGDTVPGNDEVDVLTRQFNDMVAQLDRDHRTIRELNGTLEEKVRLRTAQLEATVSRLKETQQQLTEYNRKLETAREEAESANRAKGHFLANISHELRTPLNAVLGMIELLMETRLDDQQQRFAATVKNSGASLLRLLNDVLDFSKVEAGKLDLENIEFNLRETIEPVVEAASFRCVEKPLEIAFYLDPTIPETLCGDPGRIRQVLANLVSNAVKFTERGSIVVRVERTEGGDGQHLLECSVRDTGIGIPRDRFDRLFQSFSQIDASTTRKYGGSGLGLAICRQLCDLMGGEIRFESREGEGSTFTFTVPLEIPRTQPNRPCSDTFTENWSQQWSHASVLVIDDNAPSRETLAEQLTSWGFQVEQAPDLQAGLNSLREAKPAGRGFQLVFVDSALDGLQPKEFAVQARADAADPDCRLLLMIPLGRPVKWSEVLENGFSHVLTKPVLLSTLFDAVANMTTPAGPGDPSTTDVLGRRKSRKKRSRKTKTQFPGARILLAEDNEINQDVAKEVLQRAGFHVMVVADGNQAVQAVVSQPVDLVLMDCQMPVMDGFAATQAIRNSEQAGKASYTGRLPIIALTANVLTGERERCLAAGMNDYLSKPVQPKKLIAVIDAVLAESNLRRGEADEEEAPTADDGVLTENDSGVSSLLQSLDYDALVSRCMDDEELAHKLLLKLDARIDKDLAAIADALRLADADRVGALAHGLKGSAANISAERLRGRAAELESLARGGATDGASVILEGLQREIHRLRRDIALLTAPVSVSETMILPIELPKGDVQCVS